jgi:hypothetical protein
MTLIETLKTELNKVIEEYDPFDDTYQYCPIEMAQGLLVTIAEFERTAKFNNTP